MSPLKRVLISALFISGALDAHEIGTTRVTVVFDAGRGYKISVVTDAPALADKLAALTDRPLTPANSPGHLQTMLRENDRQFRQRVEIVFDGHVVRPEIAYTVTPAADVASGSMATVVLSGQVPDKAHSFSWSYGWTFASYALTVRTADSRNPATQWLAGGQTSTPSDLSSLPPPADRLDIAWRYLRLGFTHIVPSGLDHMLFVLGIYLLSRRPRSVLLQVSAFTIAHSITLGLSMYGIITVSPRIVEPMIAVSIAYVAIENIFLSELKAWRLALVFSFGLLHGMGFAGALRELGLPRSEFVTALLTFNIGVEAGQLAVIGTAFLFVGWHFANRTWYRARIVVPASAMIAFTALCWTIQRLA